MRKLRVTDAMIARALSRTKPIPAEVVRQQRGLRFNVKMDCAFVRYQQTTVVFKVMRHYGARTKVILALAVPKGALVHRGFLGWSRRSRKCRTEEVFVLGRIMIRSGRLIQTAHQYTGPYRIAIQHHTTGAPEGYRCGETFRADGFGRSYRECAPGVHFFETLQEARDF